MFAYKFFTWLKLPGTPFSSLLLNNKGKILFIEKNGNQYKLSEQIKEGNFISSAFPDFSKERVRPLKGEVESSSSDFIAFHTMRGTGNFNHPNWFLFTFFPKSYFKPQLNVFTLNLVIAIIATVLICLLSAIYLSKKITLPLRQLYNGMNVVAEGDLDQTLHIKTGDEIEDLTEKFERMRIQLRNRHNSLLDSNNIMKRKMEKHNGIVRNFERQLYRADKLASLGELSMKLAHEIGNPLASIKTVAQAISEDMEDGQSPTRNFDKIVLEVDRLNNFLKKFNNFAVLKETEALPCDMKELVRDVNFFLRIQAKEQGISIVETFDQDLEKINVDPQQIKQALVNLILNSIQASSHPSEINVAVKNANVECDGCNLRNPCFCMENGIALNSKDFLEISICDAGEGIDEEHLIKVFDPFFTTKENGTGLGLSVVHRIVEQHRGVIRMYSKQGEGTTFKIFLPKQTNGNIS
jgi:signal transduction histidine kinase